MWKPVSRGPCMMIDCWFLYFYNRKVVVWQCIGETNAHYGFHSSNATYEYKMFEQFEKNFLKTLRVKILYDIFSSAEPKLKNIWLTMNVPKCVCVCVLFYFRGHFPRRWFTFVSNWKWTQKVNLTSKRCFW